jgi:hypothetical protein
MTFTMGTMKHDSIERFREYKESFVADVQAVYPEPLLPSNI